MQFLQKKINVVIVAGASGIGRVIAEKFNQQGAQLFVCDIDERHLSDFGQAQPNIYLQRTDVSKFNEVQAFFKTVAQKVKHIDVLINCAGIAGPTAPMDEIEPKDWERTVDVNINGMFYCLKECIPLLKGSNNGSIINLASNAAFFGFPLRSPYTAAKWATIGMTKTLAMELGGKGIRVNAICPGSVSGERINRVIEADAKTQQKSIEEIKKLYVKQSSLKSFVEPEDVAHLALFLSSDYGRFISGQAIGLDGHTEGLSNEL
ncbi:MAG: SDR family oxidoreductase [Reichenbachiella sp.]